MFYPSVSGSSMPWGTAQVGSALWQAVQCRTVSSALSGRAAAAARGAGASAVAAAASAPPRLWRLQPPLLLPAAAPLPAALPSIPPLAHPTHNTMHTQVFTSLSVYLSTFKTYDDATGCDWFCSSQVGAPLARTLCWR